MCRIIMESGTHYLSNDDLMVQINCSSSCTIILPETLNDMKEEQKGDFYIETKRIEFFSINGLHTIKPRTQASKINFFLQTINIGPSANPKQESSHYIFVTDGTGNWIAVK